MDSSGILTLTAQIVAAHASNNPTNPDALLKLIPDVASALQTTEASLGGTLGAAANVLKLLSGLSTSGGVTASAPITEEDEAVETAVQATPPAPVARKEPAVPVTKSVFPDYIVCLEDGKRMKMLKRHLSTSYNMTPDQYRARWGLSPNYPMVAPNYAETRSALAKANGLGRGRGGRPRADAEETGTATRSIRASTGTAPGRKGGGSRLLAQIAASQPGKRGAAAAAE